MLNHIVIMGRMVRDPELRQTQSGISVCSFTLACDRDFKSKAERRRRTSLTAWPGGPRRSLSASISPRAAWPPSPDGSSCGTGRTRIKTSAAARRSWRRTCTSAIPSPRTESRRRCSTALPAASLTVPGCLMALSRISGRAEICRSDGPAAGGGKFPLPQIFYGGFPS